MHTGADEEDDDEHYPDDADEGEKERIEILVEHLHITMTV
jgi:hypothetical protein